MDKVMEFLVQYYLYVALGSLAIIVVLILIIVLGNKKRKRREENEMVNIGNIQTGSVMDVANNMNPVSGPSIEPQNIGELTQNIPIVETNPVFVNQNTATGSVNDGTLNTESQTVPDVNTVETQLNSVPVSSIQEEVGIPNIGESLPKAEPIPEPVKQVEEVVPVQIPEIEQSPVNPVPVENVVEPAPVVEAPKESIPTTIENPVKEPEPVKEELEVFGIEEPTDKQGSAVSGFSSVNVEK